MGKAKERNFEALDYGKNQKANLTEKQYLIYAYLMSISKWDAQDKEDHYYVYKNSFKVKEACELIGVSQPTWRNTLKVLEAKCYIELHETYYVIRIARHYAPLHIDLIRYLINFSNEIKHGGNIVSVYSALYRYWNFCRDNGDKCEISLNQLKALFITGRHDSELEPYKLMLGLFEISGLITINKHSREYKGRTYTGYEILNVKLTPPEDMDNYGPDDVGNIMEALNNELY